MPKSFSLPIRPAESAQQTVETAPADGVLPSVSAMPAGLSVETSAGSGLPETSEQSTGAGPKFGEGILQPSHALFAQAVSNSSTDANGSNLASHQQYPQEIVTPQQPGDVEREGGLVAATGPTIAETLTVEEEALLLRQCRLAKVELVGAALDSGRVGLDYVFSNGDTLLVTACKNGFKRLVKALVRRKCPMDDSDSDGNTAAHWCFASNFAELGEYLISKGASDSITNNKGLTCRQLLLRQPSHYPASDQPPASQSASQKRSEGMKVRHGTGGGDRSFPQIVNSAIIPDPRPRGKPRIAREQKIARIREETPYERLYVNLTARAQSTPPVMKGHEIQGHSHNRGESPQRGEIHKSSHRSTQNAFNTDKGGGGFRRARSPTESLKSAESKSPVLQPATVASMFVGRGLPLQVDEERDLRSLDNFDQSPMPLPVSPKKMASPKKSTLTETDSDLKFVSKKDAADSDKQEGDASASGNNLVRKKSAMTPKEVGSTSDSSDKSRRRPSTVGDKMQARIDSPRSLEALKRLGVKVEDLLVEPFEKFLKQVNNPAIAKLRYKLTEERRLTLLARCREERLSLRARSKDATLNVLFAEYSKVAKIGDAEERTMSLNQFMQMLVQLEMMSHGTNPEQGKITKTEAVQWFRKFACGGPGLTWELFNKLERSLSATVGRFSKQSATESSSQRSVEKKSPLKTSPRGKKRPESRMSSSGSYAASVKSHESRSPISNSVPINIQSSVDAFEALRMRNEKIKQIEMRRMEKQLTVMLGQRAEHKELSESFTRKEHLRMAMLERRAFGTAEQRLEAQIRHVAKVIKQEQIHKIKQEEDRYKMLKREEEIRKNLEVFEERRKEKMLMQSEIAKFKSETQQQQLEQRIRQEDYKKEQMLLRLQRDQQRIKEEKEKRKVLEVERNKSWYQSHLDRLVLSQLAENFDKTGELKMPATASKGFEDLTRVRGIPMVEEDLNPDAVVLQQSEPCVGEVSRGQYTYFKAFVEKAKVIKFELKMTTGHATMYVGNGHTPNPTRSASTWSKGVKFSIFHVDQSFVLGYVYIGILGGQAQNSFILTCTWTDSDVLDMSAATVSASAVPPDLPDEKQMTSKMKEHVDKMTAERLADKGQAFTEKFNQLFNKSKLI